MVVSAKFDWRRVLFFLWLLGLFALCVFVFVLCVFGCVFVYVFELRQRIIKKNKCTAFQNLDRGIFSSNNYFAFIFHLFFVLFYIS